MKHNLLRVMPEYNVWANTRICKYLARGTEAQLTERIESSFPSIMKTLLHIWDGELVWLERMQGSSPHAFPSNSFQGDATELLHALPAYSQKMAQYIDSLHDSELEARVEYATLRGSPASNTRAEMLQHCMNHSTYHRGQLTMFARQLGIERPVSTDLIYYLRGSASKS